jgi:hypothetical protein
MSKRSPLCRAMALVFVILANFYPESGFAADTLAPSVLAVRSTGKTLDAEVKDRGDLFIGIGVHGAEAIFSEKILGKIDQDLAGQENQERLLRDAHRAAFFLGYNLTSRVEFTLGLHGTYEHMKPLDRDILFKASAGQRLGWRGNFKQSGFAGASMLVKFNILSHQGFSAALAPFLESGAGEQATYSLTRSVGPKGGWMVLLGYGKDKAFQLMVNSGYRYRDPESIGNLRVRNELFYQGTAKGFIVGDWALFVGGQGRRLMVAENKNDLGYKYSSWESGEFTGGIETEFDGTLLNAYYGARAKKASGFGFGKAIAGMSLSSKIGAQGRKRPRHNYGKEIRETQRAKHKKAMEEAEKRAVAEGATVETVGGSVPKEQYPEMIGEDIDPLRALEESAAGDQGNDDFTETVKKIEQENANKEMSEDLKIEIELKKLKLAEERAAKQRVIQDEKDKKRARLEGLKRSEEESRLLKTWMEEAEAESGQMEGISEEELNWNGLED